MHRPRCHPWPRRASEHLAICVAGMAEASAPPAKRARTAEQDSAAPWVEKYRPKTLGDVAAHQVRLRAACLSLRRRSFWAHGADLAKGRAAEPHGARWDPFSRCQTMAQHHNDAPPYRTGASVSVVRRRRAWGATALKSMSGVFRAPWRAGACLSVVAPRIKCRFNATRVRQRTALIRSARRRIAGPRPISAQLWLERRAPGLPHRAVCAQALTEDSECVPRTSLASIDTAYLTVVLLAVIDD